MAFRLHLLDGAGRNAGGPPSAVGGAHRQAAVLARAAQKAAWGSAMPKDVGLGVATTFGQERDMPTWVACVARVRVDRATGRVIVEKLTMVVDTYTPLRMGDVPEIKVELMPSDEAPAGLGEPGTTAVAPAIANAIFAATGARLRHLPIRAQAVRQALNTRS